MNANKTNWKRIGKNLAVAAVCSLPAFAMADVEVETGVLFEAAKEIAKLDGGIKAIGAAIVGVTITGTSYMVAKRWIRKV